jgi:hypothetical protein
MGNCGNSSGVDNPGKLGFVEPEWEWKALPYTYEDVVYFLK